MPDAIWVQAATGGLFGLLIGSFLNVVIYRLPKMMEQAWAVECAEFTGQAPSPEHSERFNLLVPRSRCQQCGHQIVWWENVPVLSYLFLRGRCSSCKTPISLRYPMVELVTGLLFAWCVWRWGWTWPALAWCGFSAVLVALTLIDWDTTLLPDALTLPLLWAGLIASILGWTGVLLTDAVWGAVGGYMSLWLVYWAFKLATGKEGMGFGDFKLFAALGAWFGWQALVPMMLMSSVIGAVVGIGLKFMSGLREGGVMPFGPFLAMAGVTAMLFGPQSILRVLGL
ncbi:prepilin peptidase [Ottowia sp.]|uniref:prepilin peptidase n=1 Tax=Ottowia sp. TaxID=1898956 RepID=UPI003A87E2F2